MFVLYVRSKDEKYWEAISVTKRIDIVRKFMDKYGYIQADWGYLESYPSRSAICSKSLRNFIDKNIS